MLNFSITNLTDKNNGVYEDLSLGRLILIDSFDMIYFSYFIEGLLRKYNDNPNSYSQRIDIWIDSGTIAKYNLPFDTFNVTLYRAGYELEKDFTSNYIYNELDGNRNFWVDLYYTKEDYDSEDVARDIMREMNNCFNRDIKEYLNSL